MLLLNHDILIRNKGLVPQPPPSKEYFRFILHEAIFKCLNTASFAFAHYTNIDVLNWPYSAHFASNFTINLQPRHFRQSISNAAARPFIGQRASFIRQLLLPIKSASLNSRSVQLTAYIRSHDGFFTIIRQRESQYW